MRWTDKGVPFGVTRNGRLETAFTSGWSPLEMPQGHLLSLIGWFAMLKQIAITIPAASGITAVE
jgi:hypothetical protein